MKMTAEQFDNPKYFRDLEKWLNEASLWQNMLGFFPYAAAAAAGAGAFQAGTAPAAAAHQTSAPAASNVAPETLQGVQGIIYEIPPLWRRIVAEILDFIILFAFKLVVTYVAVEYFNFVDLEKFDVDILNNNFRFDYKAAIEMTSEILVLELLHRLVVFIYEAYCLTDVAYGGQGGATPGKVAMGLLVVRCDRQPLPVPGRPRHALITPGTGLNIYWSISRAFLKNLVLALLFPICCFAMFLFRYQRTGYDLLCHSIVVKARTAPTRNPRHRRQ